MWGYPQGFVLISGTSGHRMDLTTQAMSFVVFCASLILSEKNMKKFGFLKHSFITVFTYRKKRTIINSKVARGKHSCVRVTNTEQGNIDAERNRDRDEEVKIHGERYRKKSRTSERKSIE